MEAGRDQLSEESQRGLPVRPVAEIAQNLVESAVFLHDIDDVLYFFVKEIHHLLIPSARLKKVSIIVCYPRRQFPERLAVRNATTNQGRMFQLELILIVRPQ